jgi:predicted RND superfamily exporter protein
VEEIASVLKERMRTDTTSPTIESVETLQERFPTTEQEEVEKLQKIAEIRELLKDPFLVDREDEDLDKLRKAAQTTEPISIEQIPDYLKSRFVTKDGDVGRFVIVYPSVGLSDGRKSIAFKNDVGAVTLDSGAEFYASSTTIVAASMLDLMRTESPYMVAATFIFIYFFMLFSFRSFRWSVISMLPLLVGLLWLFGVMIIFGLQFNFYNLVVLPAILGIGEDSGVHLAHRYRDEGKNSMWQVLSSTGQHITMGSLTTMLGFAGLLFTNHPGLQSIGIMATVGIGMTLLTSVTFLPALIQWLEDKDWIRF